MLFVGGIEEMPLWLDSLCVQAACASNPARCVYSAMGSVEQSMACHCSYPKYRLWETCTTLSQLLLNCSSLCILCSNELQSLAAPPLPTGARTPV